MNLRLLILFALPAVPLAGQAETKVKTSGITDGAITTPKLAADSVTAGKIVDGAVGAAEIDAGAVGTSEVADGSLVADDLAPSLDFSGKAIVMPAGAVLQVAAVQSGAVATGTTILPSDDTVPQITEGDQYMTVSITPRSTTSRLRVDVVFSGSISIAGTLTVALFQDATANALAATASTIGAAGELQAVTLTHYMTAGTTAPITFRVRAGPSGAGTTTFNGTGGARRYGGVMASSVAVTEVAQ